MTAEKYFPDISSRSWEHPHDKLALDAFKSLPGAGELVKIFIGLTSEKSFRLLALSSCAHVSESQFSLVYRLTQRACEILDISEMPDVFISQNPFFNASVIGVNKPIITLNSSLISILDEKELLGIIGHELGHCLSGHVVYKTLLWFLLNVSAVSVRSLPLGALAMSGLVAALRDWDRKSELSADRAGLLVTQDPRASISALMKMAGGSDLSQMDINEFKRQAFEYEQADDVLDTLHKFLNTVGQSHPFPVVRMTELDTWEKSGKYQDILNGNYGRRQDEKEDAFFTDFVKNFNKERENEPKQEKPHSQAEETISKAAQSFQAGVGKAQAEIESFLKSILGSDK